MPLRPHHEREHQTEKQRGGRKRILPRNIRNGGLIVRGGKSKREAKYPPTLIKNLPDRSAKLFRFLDGRMEKNFVGKSTWGRLVNPPSDERISINKEVEGRNVLGMVKRVSPKRPGRKSDVREKRF